MLKSVTWIKSHRILSHLKPQLFYFSQVMKVLSQAVQPAISDIQLEWSMPPGFELIQTPSQHAPIFRGEPIVVYAVLFDKARMESTLANVLSKTNHRSQLIDVCLSRESSSERIEGADYGSSLLMAGSPYRVRRRQDIDSKLSLLFQFTFFSFI